MRTNIAVLIFAAIGISLLVVQMSGLPAILGAGDTSGYQADDRVKEMAGDNKPSAQGDAIGESPSALQFLVGAADTLIGWATGVFLLPATFDHWLPWYLAYPFGLGLQSLAIISIAQFVGGPWQ